MNKLEQAIKHVLITKNFLSVHAVALFISIGTMVHSYIWAGTFAYAALEKNISSAEIAAIILAVTAPASALVKYSYDTYSESRK